MELNSVILVFHCRTVHVLQSYETDFSHAWLLLVVYCKPVLFLLCLHSKDLKAAVVTRQMWFFFSSLFFFLFTLATQFQRFTFLTSDRSPSPPGDQYFASSIHRNIIVLGGLGFIGHADPKRSKTPEQTVVQVQALNLMQKGSWLPYKDLHVFYIPLLQSLYFSISLTSRTIAFSWPLT